MRIAKTAAAVAIAALAFGLPAGADTLTFSLSQAYTGNLFQTLASGSDRITMAGLSFEKSLSSFSVFASADTTFLWQNSGLNDLDFSAGVDYVAALGPKTAAYFALQGELVRHRPEYVDFDRSGVRLTASLKTYLSPSSIFKAVSATEYRAYGFSPFDFLSHGLTASLDKYFPSKTTFKAEAAWGFKYFLHPWLTAPVAPSAEAGAAETFGWLRMTGSLPGTTLPERSRKPPGPAARARAPVAAERTERPRRRATAPPGRGRAGKARWARHGARAAAPDMPMPPARAAKASRWPPSMPLWPRESATGSGSGWPASFRKRSRAAIPSRRSRSSP